MKDDPAHEIFGAQIKALLHSFWSLQQSYSSVHMDNYFGWFQWLLNESVGGDQLTVLSRWAISLRKRCCQSLLPLLGMRPEYREAIQFANLIIIKFVIILIYIVLEGHHVEKVSVFIILCRF